MSAPVRLACALVLAGCGASPAPASTTGAVGPGPGGVRTMNTSGAGGLGTFTGAGLGQDSEHPVPVCGALESYLYVARDYRCPGGGNPLGGDPRRGQAARRGNVGPHSHPPSASAEPFLDAHIVDLYEIPCPTGPQELYVCLYHCPPGRSPID